MTKKSRGCKAGDSSVDTGSDGGGGGALEAAEWRREDRWWCGFDQWAPSYKGGHI